MQTDPLSFIYIKNERLRRGISTKKKKLCNLLNYKASYVPEVGLEPTQLL